MKSQHKEVNELPVWKEDGTPNGKFWEEYQKIMKPVFEVKLHTGKRCKRNSIWQKSRQDKAQALNKT